MPCFWQKSVDVTKFSGSNGKVNLQSHKNFLYVLSTHDALLPHKTGACLIIPHNKHYIVVYRKCSPKEGETTIAITTYAPPQSGGAFSPHGNVLVDYYPIIAEFTYVKMIATLLLKQMNDINLLSNKPMVAQGPIGNKMMNIKYACNVFELTGSYRAFCKAHMSVNSMTLVVHPVGQHFDYFHKGKESLDRI